LYYFVDFAVYAMITSMAFKVGQVAKQIGRSPTWIRDNTTAFAEFFSDLATPPKGDPRVYTDQDIRVLLTIDERRNLGKSDDEIRADLGTGILVDPSPLVAEQPKTAKSRAAATTDLITEVEARLSQAFSEMKGKHSAVMMERDHLREQLADAQDQIGELRERAASAEAVLERIDQQAVISVVHSQATQQGVDDTEPSRPWWKFWGD
jgi:DNA-binding transcriptional MerR regulator